MNKFGKDFLGDYKPQYHKNTWDFKVKGIKTDLKTLYASGISNASLDGLACGKCGSEIQVASREKTIGLKSKAIRNRQINGQTSKKTDTLMQKLPYLATEARKRSKKTTDSKSNHNK